MPPLLGGHMPMDPRFAQPLPYMAYQQVSHKRGFEDAFARAAGAGECAFVQLDAGLVSRPPVQGPVVWRCLDSSHQPGECACKEPPRVQQESCFELTGGGVTSKEGEKARCCEIAPHSRLSFCAAMRHRGPPQRDIRA